MTEIISTIVIAISAVVTATATVILAKITSRYAETTDKILRAANKPEVILYLSPEVGTMNLCIQNIGMGYASNIKFTVDYPPNHTSPSGEKFENSDVCKNGIDYLGHEHKEKVLLFFLDDILNLPKHSFNITATYKDSANTEHKKTFKFEIRNWKNISQFRTPQVSDVAVALQNINETLKSLRPQSSRENGDT